MLSEAPQIFGSLGNFRDLRGMRSPQTALRTPSHSTPISEVCRSSWEFWGALFTTWRSCPELSDAPWTSPELSS
eukprot:11730429-Alexandrium_andersonii.AAC.1